MKKTAYQIGILLFGLLIIGAAFYVVPYTIETFTNPSYRFVLSFILLVFVSNLLARIATLYINS